MIELVIFDMDGVLLNSEQLYLDMNQQWFKKIGVSISVAEHQTYIGASAKLFWTYLKQNNNLPEEIAYYIEKEKELKYKMLQKSTLTPTDGVLDFLIFLQGKKIKIALASSSLRQNINLILEKLRLENLFDYIISGEQVSNGKPSPDIFLAAATHFNIEPENCLVIEDSTNGVKAAHAAGMYVVGYNNPTSGNQNLQLANIIIENFTQQKLYTLF